MGRGWGVRRSEPGGWGDGDQEWGNAASRGWVRDWGLEDGALDYLASQASGIRDWESEGQAVEGRCTGLGTRETGRGNGDYGSGVLTMVVRQDLLYYIWATGYERDGVE